MTQVRQVKHEYCLKSIQELHNVLLTTTELTLLVYNFDQLVFRF